MTGFGICGVELSVSVTSVRPVSHLGNATAIRSRKNHFTVAYWFVKALLPPARTRCDDDSPWLKCSQLFPWSNHSRVTSVGDRPYLSGSLWLLLWNGILYLRTQRRIVKPALINPANLEEWKLLIHMNYEKEQSMSCEVYEIGSWKRTQRCGGWMQLRVILLLCTYEKRPVWDLPPLKPNFMERKAMSINCKMDQHNLCFTCS
jgi:hypothetical protein